MEFTQEHLTKLLIKRLHQTPEYAEALALAQACAKGNIYLIGGSVSRTLIQEIYGGTQTGFDFDFLIENLQEPLPEMPGWRMERKKHGNPTFFKGNMEVDLFPIATSEFIKEHALAPTLENFFLGVPFSIQALAFDVKKGLLIGEQGMLALKNREYKVNNKQEASRMAERKGISINERIKAKAQSCHLTPVFIEE